MADVHSLFGAKLDDQGVNQDVVEHIRGLLIEAERGDIVAFSAAWLDSACVANASVTSSNGRAAALGGAIAMLKHRYFTRWREDTDKQ